MNNIIVNNNNINVENISTDKQIAYISDIHGEADKLEEIIGILKELKITALLIGGDLIDNTKDTARNERIKELLQELSETTKIFIGLGNHDMTYFDRNSTNRCHAVPSIDTKYWSDLNSINNIYVSTPSIEVPTITTWSLDKDIDITAFNLPTTHYINNEPEEEFKAFLKILEETKLNIEKYNILLCHSPKNIGKDSIIKEYAECLKKFNLILAGHMHGGLLPRMFRKTSYGGGIAGPNNTFLPEYAYGIKIFGNTKIVVSGGVVKMATSAAPEIITTNCIYRGIGDILYPPEIEMFYIESNENTEKSILI